MEEEEEGFGRNLMVIFPLCGAIQSDRITNSCSYLEVI